MHAARVIFVVLLLSPVALACGMSVAVQESSIVEVVDGDTVVVRLGGRDETVRLIGIDTPETKHPSKPIECFGPEASAFTAQLLPDGVEVRLERDVEARDHFGRVLAYVYRADDGMFVNLELARQGFAKPLSIAPNNAHAPAVASAAREARSNGRGLWRACPTSS